MVHGRLKRLLVFVLLAAVLVLLGVPGAVGAVGPAASEGAGAKAKEALQALKAAKTKDEKLVALERIQKLPSPEAVVPVGKLLDESDDDLVISAAMVLGEIGNKEAAALLLRRLQGADVASKPALAIALIEGVGETGDVSAIQVLSNYRHNSDGQVVVAAVRALGKMKSGKAVEELINTLSFWQRRVTTTSRTRQKKATIIVPAAREALISLTRQALPAANDYRLWWEANKSTFKFEEGPEAGPQPGAGTGTQMGY